MRGVWFFFFLAIAATTASTGRSDVWTRHDPDFAVRVDVAPFADDQWNATTAEYDALAPSRDGELAIPSSVLNITVEIPASVAAATTQVTVTLFKRRQPTSSADDRSRAVETSDDDDSDSAGFVVLAETQVQYAKSYRLDVGTSAAQKMVLRVYVESSRGTNGHHVSRAMYVRPLDLSPSDPIYLNCGDKISESDDIALHLASYPPTNMPTALCRKYTMDGRVPIRKWYFDDQSDTDRTYEERSFEFIESLVVQARQRKRYYYGKTDDYLYEALQSHPIQGQHVLIIGSTMPWYEAICIAMDAASCTTIDYNRLRYHHPKLTTWTLAEFEATSPQTTRKQFDVIFSISSFEHDGLGRYGDPLDADADLHAMERLLQYTKPPGSTGSGTTKVMLAVPVGHDTVVWNAQRIYGPLRLPLLMTHWTVVDSFGFSAANFTAPFTVDHQPLFVLEPKPMTGNDHSEL